MTIVIEDTVFRVLHTDIELSTHPRKNWGPSPDSRHTPADSPARPDKDVPNLRCQACPGPSQTGHPIGDPKALVDCLDELYQGWPTTTVHACTGSAVENETQEYVCQVDDIADRCALCRTASILDPHDEFVPRGRREAPARREWGAFRVSREFAAHARVERGVLQPPTSRTLPPHLVDTSQAGRVTWQYVP